mgnify:CR=1 FL=1
MFGGEEYGTGVVARLGGERHAAARRQGGDRARASSASTARTWSAWACCRCSSRARDSVAVARHHRRRDVRHHRASRTHQPQMDVTLDDPPHRTARGRRCHGAAAASTRRSRSTTTTTAASCRSVLREPWPERAARSARLRLRRSDAARAGARAAAVPARRIAVPVGPRCDRQASRARSLAAARRLGPPCGADAVRRRRAAGGTARGPSRSRHYCRATRRCTSFAASADAGARDASAFSAGLRYLPLSAEASAIAFLRADLFIVAPSSWPPVRARAGGAR